ncbi:MAG: ABC transporter substrate-binding protein [Lachnospiraceae bacterium]|nr:ABC transporter substrate-binding protein [Lachnospiraceae bacterium]
MKLREKIVAIGMVTALMMGAMGCGNAATTATDTAVTDNSAVEETNTDAAAADTTADTAEDSGKVYKVGLCNYVADASLDQICDNIQATLDKIGTENGVKFEVQYDNCNADSNVLNQIVANFIADDVDLMIGVATPVAMSMQAAGSDIPIVFSAVTDPVGAGLVNSLEAPGANITGTSDYLDTNAVMNLIFAADPDVKKIGLLYDLGQDASTTPIADAKAYLDSKGIEYVERTGTSVDEVVLAAQALISDGVDAVFTPQDNTIMQAELSIYEELAAAGIPHYTGADSFALNGAFLGYGVDYANLGVETAYMVKDILVDGKEPATLAVKTFDNGTATVNTETCAAIGFDMAKIKEVFAPLCTSVNEITTAESFE